MNTTLFHDASGPVVLESVAAPRVARPIGFHGAVHDFKRRLIEATLYQLGGNRTHTARALGLQRTYLLRLMRELQVTSPPASRGNGARVQKAAGSWRMSPGT